MALWAKEPQQPSSTQEHLRFAEIRDSLIITKVGELRAVLLASSINFALKSEQEQNAIIFAYQNFLNSLNFPLQIVMQSKKLDLSKYLAKLQEVSNSQTNELLRLQTVDYIDFIKRLINIANIMDKKFYVVVPYLPPPKIQAPTKILKKPTEASPIQITIEEFSMYKKELTQRIQVIQSGLGSIGLRSAQLNTQQIIELLYGIYNPEEASKEKLIEYENLITPLVESEIEKPEPKEKNEQPQPATIQ